MPLEYSDINFVFYECTKEPIFNITPRNVEQLSLFLLNCDNALFNPDNMDSFRPMRQLLNEKYRYFARLLFTLVDIEREEKIKRITQALEDMIPPAKKVMSYLTDDGLEQLQLSLTAGHHNKKKKCSAVATLLET